MIRDTFDFAADAIVQAFGDEVAYKGNTIRAVFGSGFQRVESGDVRVASRRPEISVRLDDLPTAPEKGEPVTVRSLAYEVAAIRPDVEDVSVTLVLKAI
ncbi:MAG TPA: hypothetical protein VK966_02670 [Longimicrobiales bacterium]|nr:hypothetical protein [Longimicrobiales bacterium]